jgi:hypothetical protein
MSTDLISSVRNMSYSHLLLVMYHSLHMHLHYVSLMSYSIISHSAYSLLLLCLDMLLYMFIMPLHYIVLLVYTSLCYYFIHFSLH